MAGSGLADEVRDYDKFLSSNDTMAESDGVLGDNDTRSSDGFQTTNSGVTNQSSQPYVAWNWLGANGTTTNDASATGVGSIDSVYSANTTAGFSIVSYTGTGSNGTVAHGLGAAPKWVIVKKRSDTSDWVVWHEGLGDGTKYIILDTTQATLTATNIWNSTIPTSSVFSVGTHTTINNASATYIAYVFSEIESYSKFGSYTGNGSTDGVFVYTGFRPAWVMTKRTDTAKDWIILDNKRDVDNVAQARLFPNLNDAESTTQSPMDILSNGFKLRISDANYNASGGTWIYMAFAEMPFKYANAR